MNYDYKLYIKRVVISAVLHNIIYLARCINDAIYAIDQKQYFDSKHFLLRHAIRIYKYIITAGVE